MVKCKTKITQNELDALIVNQSLSKKNKSYFHYNFVRAVIFGVFCIFSVFMATVGATLKQKFILKKMQNKADAKMKSGVREYEFSEKRSYYRF